MLKVVIFDVDGTLLDPKDGLFSALKHVIKTHKLSLINENTMESFIGPPIQDSLKRVYGMSDKKAQECANTFRDRYSKIDVFKSQVYDGIYELLELLKAKKFKMGVATYKRQDYAISLLEHLKLANYFDIICGADNENKLKKIDIVKKCADELRDKCIMIGDSSHDAQAANNLGIDFIGVTYGFGFKNFDDIMEFHPVFCASSPEELIEYFK